ncbi:MAG: hypothetical protein ACREJQ_03090, partial [bacterium]
MAPPTPPTPPPGSGGLLRPASGGLDGPTPYIFPVYPLEGTFVTEGGLTPLTIQVQIQDELSVGISSVYFALDLKVATPTYNPSTGVASFTLAGLLPGNHLLNVLARDNTGNQYERGWAFNTDPAPPPITAVAFDATTGDEFEIYSAFYITLYGDLNPATVGNAAYWQVLDSQNLPVATVTSVDIISSAQRARLHISPALYLKLKYKVDITYGEGTQRGCYGFGVAGPAAAACFQAPSGGDSPIGGGGLDSGGLGGGADFGPGWSDYQGPGTPISACYCSPHDPICDDPNQPPEGIHFGGYQLAIDPGNPPPPPPPPPPPAFEYYWENLDPNHTYDANWWCSHFKIDSDHQPGYQENYIHNKDIRWLPNENRYDYDLDMTHDLSWNGGPPHWDDHPTEIKHGDAALWHQTNHVGCYPHPDPALNDWNLADIQWGWPPLEIYPQTPDWGRGEPFTWFSRYVSDGYLCGVANQDFVTPPSIDNFHPEFVPPYPKIIT